MDTELKKRIGAKVRAAREANNINKTRFCLMVGVSRPVLDRIENGEENVKLDTLTRVAAGLGMTPRDLLE